MNSQPHSFIAAPQSLPALRRLIAIRSRQFGWEDDCLDMTIAIGEIVQNIIRHGFLGISNVDHRFWVDVEQDHAQLIWSIEDNAPPSDPLLWRRQPKISGGGYGLCLIERLASKVEFMPLATGNKVRLWFSKRD